MMAASIILTLAMGYLLLGAIFYIPFILKGIKKIDHGAVGAPLSFRLLILPGVMVFWPLLLSKWIAKNREK